MKISVTILIILAIAVAAFFILQSKATGAVVSEDVAKYIGERSVLYVQKGCIHCERQLDLFGSNKKYLNIIDCSESTTIATECYNNGITSTPTWIINGEQYVGFKTIEELKELTGYQ